MAIVVVNTGTFQCLTDPDDVIIPVGGQQDDILVCSLASDDLILNTSDAGFNILYNSGIANPGGAVYLYRFTSSPITTFSQPNGGTTGDSALVAMTIYRGVDTTTAVDAPIQTAIGPGVMPDPPSYTTVTDGAMRSITGHLDDDSVIAIPPATYTDGVSLGFANDATTMMASKLETTPKADDPDPFGGGGQDANEATHFALRPSDVTPPEPAARRTGKVYRFG